MENNKTDIAVDSNGCYLSNDTASHVVDVKGKSKQNSKRKMQSSEGC